MKFGSELTLVADKTIDWWTLGVLLYEMLSGLPPFYDGELRESQPLFGLADAIAENTEQMYQKILQDPLVFGDDISPQARSILTGLLTREPMQRLGVNGAEEIKKHPFFAKNIDFNRLLKKQIQPPFKPSVASPVVRLHFMLHDLLSKFTDL